MGKDATPGVCDVLGCDAPGTGSYLHARDARALEFRICDAHSARLRTGEQPVIVAERLDLADLGGRPALMME